MQNKKIIIKFKLFALPFFIFFSLILVIFLTNYKRGTFLSGWDNLQTEFSPVLAIKRSIFGVWQEYQGLGLLAGMGHASDLIRQIFTLLLSVFLPESFIRYFYHFLMLFIGSLGLYVFLYSSILDKFKGRIRILASFSGSFLYLFNLATIQMFYVPYEPFSTHFAFLPWLFWANQKFLNTPSKRNLLLLIFINIFSISQGYVGTIFFVYVMVLAIFFLFKFFQSIKNLKNILISIIIIVLINSFWLIPNLHFALSKSSVNLQSKSNQMVTNDNFLRNKKYGDIENVILLKGFWFDNIEINDQGIMDYQLGKWVKHLNKDYIVYLGYFIFLSSLMGIFFALIHKNINLYPFIIIFIFSTAIIGNDIPYMSKISEFFYTLPLFKQIFRTPYTKFAFILAFSMSVFYGYFLSIFTSSLKSNKVIIITAFSFIILPLIFSYPMLSGNLFYSRIKSSIPNEYFETFDFFRGINPNARIANFPQYTYWGWTFYRWNYSGSGFLWYGIEQPIIDRAFDVWSGENENYYHEITYALYSGQKEIFEKILEKYQIEWLLIDYNVVSFSNAKELYWDRLIKILNSSDKIGLNKRFGNIEIYNVNLSNKTNNFVYAVDNLKTVDPVYKWNNNDVGFYLYNNYKSASISDNPTQKVYYPFRSLFTGRDQGELEFQITELGDEFVFKSKIPNELSGQYLIMPSLEDEEKIEVQFNNSLVLGSKLPQVYLDGILLAYNQLNEINSYIQLPKIRTGNLEIKIPKKSGLYSYNSDIGNNLIKKTTESCDVFNRGDFNSQVTEIAGKKWLRLFSLGSSNCFEINLSRLSHKFGYLVKIESFNKEGKSLLFTARNKISKRSDIEVYLPQSQNPINSYYILQPMEEYGAGYILNFDNISIGRERSINFISNVSINPIPYNFLTKIKIGNVDSSNLNTSTLNSSYMLVNHPNPSRYEINFKQFNPLKDNSTIILSQSYDKGWRLYSAGCHNGLICRLKAKIPFLFYKETGDHVLVNNWENGWILNHDNGKNQDSYIIIYKPQYLEYLGFALWLLIPLMFFFVKPQLSSSVHKEE